MEIAGNMACAIGTIAKNPDSETYQLLDKHMVDQIISNKVKASERMKVNIPYFLDNEQRSCLSRMYPEFEFDFGVCMSGHAVAAASRICETKLIWNLVNVKSAEKFLSNHKEYDDYLTDIGGNFVTNLKNGIVNGVHSCEPILSLYDSHRRTDRILKVMNLDHNKLSQDSIDVLNSRKSLEKIRCEKKFQNCERTSIYGMSIHSAYDIKLQDFIDGMDKKNMMCAYLTMIFDPRMFHQTSAIIDDLEVKWSIEKGYISFHFYKESSHIYRHKVSDYLKYFTKHEVVSTKNKRHYSIELLINRDCISFIKILYVEDTGYTPSIMSHGIPFSYNSEMIAITYYSWNRLISDKTSRNVIKGLLRPVIFVIQNADWQNYLNFALRLESTKFNALSIFEYVISQKFRSIDNQKHVVLKNLGDVTELFYISQAVYLTAFTTKYDSGKLLKFLIDEQNYFRKHGSMNVFRTLFGKISNFLSNKTVRILEKLTAPPAITEVLVNKVEVYRTFSDLQGRSKLINWTYGTVNLDMSWCVNNQKNFSVLEKLAMDSDDVEMFTVSKNGRKLISREKYKEKKLEKLSGAGAFSICDLKEGVNRYPAGSLVPCNKACNNRRIPNDADGFCLYYSCLGYSDRQAANSLRKRMLEQDLDIYVPDVRRSIIEDLTSSEGSNAIETIFDIFSAIEHTKVFLHTSGECKCRVYGNTNWKSSIHVFYHNKHFERIDVEGSKNFYDYGAVYKPLSVPLAPGYLNFVEVTKDGEVKECTSKVSLATIKKSIEISKNYITKIKDSPDKEVKELKKKKKEKPELIEMKVLKSVSEDSLLEEEKEVKICKKRETPSPELIEMVEFNRKESNPNSFYLEEEQEEDYSGIKKIFEPRCTPNPLKSIKRLFSKKDEVFNEILKSFAKSEIIAYDEKSEKNFIVESFGEVPRIPSVSVLKNANLNKKNFRDLRFVKNLYYRFIYLEVKDIIIIEVKESNRNINKNFDPDLLIHHIYKNFDATYISDKNMRTIKIFDGCGISIVRTYPKYYEIAGKRVIVSCNGEATSVSFYRRLISKQFADENFLNKKRVDHVYLYDPHNKVLPSALHKYLKYYYTSMQKKDENDRFESRVQRFFDFGAIKGENIILHLHSSVAKETEKIFSEVLKLSVNNVIILVHSRDHYKSVHSKFLKNSIDLPSEIHRVDLEKVMDNSKILSIRASIEKMPDEDFLSYKNGYLSSLNRPLHKSAAAKLDEILSEHVLNPEVMTDLCANPGGFSKMLNTRYPGAVLYVHCFYGSKSCDPIDKVLLDARNVCVIAKKPFMNYYGNLLDDYQLNYVKTMINESDLITADGCACEGPDDKNNIKLLLAQINIAKSKLKPGGMFVLKTFIGFEVTDHLRELSKYFSASKLIKPYHSNVLSNEVYGVFTGFTDNPHGETLINEDFITSFKAYENHMLCFDRFVSEHCFEDEDDEVHDSESSDSGSEDEEEEEDKEQDRDDDELPVFSKELVDLYKAFTEDTNNEINKYKLLIAMEDAGYPKNVLEKLDETSFKDFTYQKEVITTIDGDTVIQKFNGKSYKLKPLSKVANKMFGIKDSDLHKLWNKSGKSNKFDPLFEYEPSDGYIQRNAVREVLEIYKTTPILIENCLKVLYTEYRVKQGCDSDFVRKYLRMDTTDIGIWNVKKKEWTVKPKSGLEYKHYFDGNKLINADQRDNSHVEYLMVNNECQFIHEIALYNSLKDLNVYQKISADVHFIQGVPGCGKTTYICNNIRDGDLVLTSTREGAKTVKARIEDKDVTSMTIHSYLMNSDKTFDRVWVDEFLMRHYGEIIMVMLKANCKEIYLIGDKAQIPYFNRSPSFLLNYSVSTEFIKPETCHSLSYRCPVDVAYMFRKDYDGGFKSNSKVIKSMKTQKVNTLGDIPKCNDKQYLVFKQIDKQTMISQGFKNVNTIGETQGLEFDEVCLVRLSKILVEEIFLKREQQLVGCTRHKRNLTYYTVVEDNLFNEINKLPDINTIKTCAKSDFQREGKRKGKMRN